MRRNSRRFHRRSAARVVARGERRGRARAGRSRRRASSSEGDRSSSTSTSSELGIGDERGGERSRRARERDERLAEERRRRAARRRGRGGPRAAVRSAGAVRLARVGGTLDRWSATVGVLEHRAVDHAAVSWCVMPRLRVAAAQLNLVVGDLEGNAARMLDAYERADAAGCDLVAFPELAVTGYPPEDLLLRPAFVAQAAEALEKIAARTGRAAAVVGLPRGRRATSTTRPRCARTGRCSASTASTCCPTTRCSTSSATSRRRPIDGPLFVVGGRAGRGHDLRGRVEPERPDRSRRPRAAPSSS